MCLFPQAEFEWKSPKNSRIAIERAIDRNRGQFWRTRIFIAILLFLGYLSLFPFWIDSFLPPGSRSQRSQGQIDRLPCVMAMFGCLAFAMVFGPSWFRQHWVERIRLRDKWLTSTRAGISSSNVRISNCTVHDLAEFLIVEIESIHGIVHLYGGPANLDLNRLREVFAQHGIEVRSSLRQIPLTESQVMKELDRLVSKQHNSKFKRKKPASKTVERAPNVRSLMVGILILGTLFGTCLRLKRHGDDLYWIIVKGTETMTAFNESAQAAKESAGDDWPSIRAQYEIRMVRQENRINSLVSDYARQLIPMLALALVTYFVTPFILIRILWQPSMILEITNSQGHETSSVEQHCNPRIGVEPTLPDDSAGFRK